MTLGIFKNSSSPRKRGSIPLDSRFCGNDEAGCRFKNRRADWGFSLTEAAIVLALIGTLAAVIIPSLLFWQRANELSHAAKSLKTALDAVRAQSTGQGRAFGVGLHVSALGADNYEIIGLYDLDDASDNIHAKTHSLPSSVRFQIPLPGAGVAATAQDTGFTNSSDGLVAFRRSGEMESRYLASTGNDPSIVLAGRSGKTKMLTINRVTGNITVT